VSIGLKDAKLWTAVAGTLPTYLEVMASQLLPAAR